MKEICLPCPVVQPFVPAPKLPEVLCPCPEPVAGPNLLPTITYTDNTVDDFEAVLKAMTSNLYCVIPE